MESLLRNWNCRGCGRDNKTSVATNGTVTCEYCADVKIIQPARNRGGETPLQISRFTRKNATRHPGPDNRELDPPSAGDVVSHDDSERREAFVRLRETYLEAQKRVTSDGPYTNLEWILGERSDATQNPPALAEKTVELVGLWLQDLASELDRQPPGHGQAGRTLRDAMTRFLLAFRSRPVGPVETSGLPRFEDAVAR
jgi:hypothetical protein